MSLLSPQLEAFAAVAAIKTVHAAAESLHLTQTAVTQRIRTLETKLKTTLFIRTRRGMLLTSEGEALLRYCHATKELEGETLARIQGAAIQTEIQICITGPTSLMRSRIIPCCLAITINFPQLLFKFDINDRENRTQTLRSGQCDFAIVRQQDVAQEMQYKLLAPEQYVLVCSKQWQGRKLRYIIQNERIIDFDESDQTTFDYLKQYRLFDLALHGRHFVNRTEFLAMLVASAMGYTTLAKEFAKPYVKNNQLITLNAGKTHDIQFVLAWYPRPEPAKYFTAIIDAIR